MKRDNKRVVVEVIDVSKKFREVTVLEHINLKLESGNIYGFIGPNGSGKTVLLKMICGFYAPSSGKILINSKNIIEEKTYPDNTGALIEKPTFIPDLTGKENLMLLAKIQNKITEKDIDKIVEIVGLNKYINNKYNTYSLGTKQKLGIAQAIMENPDLIILDEPFNGLDDISAKNIRNYLLEKKKEDKLIIISTHIKDDIALLSDKTYLFENENVIFQK